MTEFENAEVKRNEEKANECGEASQEEEKRHMKRIQEKREGQRGDTRKERCVRE